MKKIRNIVVPLIILLIIGFIYYYINLPALNIHSGGFWGFIIILFILISVATAILGSKIHAQTGSQQLNFNFEKPLQKNKLFIVGVVCTTGLIVIYLIGSLLSSPIVNARKYRELIDISTKDFAEDIEQISYKEIPILDRDSAALIGSRKMGSMVEYVSQFEVANDYTQINYNGVPTRVTPLEYASPIKWLTNNSDGIPAYISIDMTTQTAELIKLPNAMKYSESEYFGRNIHRYLRFKYPTYIFDDLKFEIDDEGTPFWVCPVKDFTIGLFGGQTVKNVVLVNAITGELDNYKIDEVPTWIDRAYSSELLISYYDYYGTLTHGYLNTIFGQRDALQTTEGYNYVAMNDDVWVYTGVTSVTSDESIVGFVLMNQRTSETRYYSISGAKELSAMGSAEGKIQHLGYQATFPLLLNIANEPTYFIALKDGAGLVKQYAMVNIQQYTVVATGASVTECEKNYILQLKESNITVTDSSTLSKATGKIEKIAEGVVEGDSHYYIILENSDKIYDVSVVDYINIVKYNVGDKITLTFAKGEASNTVLSVE
jgi:hypothetical protein